MPHTDTPPNPTLYNAAALTHAPHRSVQCSDDPAFAAAIPASNPFEALCDGTAGGGGVVPAMPPLPGFDMGDLAGGLECMLKLFEDSLKLTTDPDCVAMTTAFEAVGVRGRCRRRRCAACARA